MAESAKVDADDPAFVDSLKKGDAAAFERLVRDHAGRLLSVARRLLRSEDDAQDALQDAFLSAFRALERFETRARLSTWLHRIVVNASLMKLRRRQRKPEESIEDLLPKFKDDGHHADPPGPWRESSGAERNELRQVVRESIDRLPETHRTVLLLRDIEGFDTEETAKLLEVTSNAVKIRLHRARLALRGLIDPTLAF